MNDEQAILKAFDFAEEAALSAAEVADRADEAGCDLAPDRVRGLLEQIASKGLVSSNTTGAGERVWSAEVAPQLESGTAAIVEQEKKSTEWEPL